MKRAQAAVEYLMILAVVIIIALVVVGVLGGFPSLTSGITERESAAYWTSADMGVARYFGNASGMLMVIRNNKNFAVKLTRVDINGVPGSVLSDTLQPGETTTLELVHTTACGSGTFSKNIAIKYEDSTYGTPYTFTGAKPLVGVCQ